VSSVLAWSATPPKEKQETDDVELIDEESEAEGEVEIVAEEAVEKKVYVKFQESEYPHRYLNLEKTCFAQVRVSKDVGDFMFVGEC